MSENETQASLQGQVLTSQISDHNDEFVFVQVAGQTAAVPLTEFTEVPATGSDVQLFVYTDMHDHLRGTTKLPLVRIDHYAFGTVTRKLPKLGVFVDIGLPDKDIVVSLDILPEDPSIWPQPNDRLLVSLTVDRKGRLWGQLAGPDIVQAIASPAKAGQRNQTIHGTVVRVRDVGVNVLTDDYQGAFIHYSEWFTQPRLGEQIEARVIGTTQHHGLNLSMKPMAYEEISDDAQMILAMLEQTPGGVLPFSDKSTPEDIAATFAISKGAFKRAVGNLLKQHRIEQKDGQLQLVTKDES